MNYLSLGRSGLKVSELCLRTMTFGEDWGWGASPAESRRIFDAFAGASLRQIMLVHDVGNPASCRVAEKAGYPFRELSPANPPHWFTDGHIHMRLGG